MGLFRTMAEAEHSDLREWPEVEPEQRVKCPRLGPRAAALGSCLGVQGQPCFLS